MNMIENVDIDQTAEVQKENALTAAVKEKDRQVVLRVDPDHMIVVAMKAESQSHLVVQGHHQGIRSEEEERSAQGAPTDDLDKTDFEQRHFYKSEYLTALLCSFEDYSVSVVRTIDWQHVPLVF